MADVTARRALLKAGGEMGRLIADLDWAGTPLGPLESWSSALFNTVSVMLPANAQIVVFWGPRYIALYNDAYAPTIGEKHPRALGRPAEQNWSELWSDLEPLLRRVRDNGETVFAKDRPFYIERHGAGEEVYFDISYSPVREEDGSIGGILCIVNETTQQVRANRRISEERERLAQMFDQAPGFMALLQGPQHVYELTNAAYQKLIGGHEVIGKPVRDALPDAERQGFIELLDRAYATGEPFTGHGMRYTMSSGTTPGAAERVLDFVCQPVKDQDGRTTGLFVEGMDVTDAVRAIEQRQESEARFQAIANSVDQMIWSTLPDGYHDYYNQRWYDYTGVPAGSTDGEAWNGMFHPDDRERAWSLWRHSLQTGEPYHIEYRLRHRSGQYRWVLGRAQPVRDKAGRIVRWYGTCTDIHDLKEATDALREESAALEILNRTAAKVAAELNLGALVQTVVDAGVQVSGAQFGAFFYNVIGDAGESYMLYAISGVDRGEFEKFPMPRNTAVFSATFTGEGPVRSGDITADPRYGRNEPHRGMPPGHLPVRSYLAVPVVSRSGEVIGGLFFGHEKPDVFTERAERIAMGLAAQAAIGIDNVRLFQSTQRHNVDLEALVRERTAERDRLWDLTDDLLATADYAGRLLRISPSWSRTLGYGPAQIMEKPYASLVDPEDRDMVFRQFVTMRVENRAIRFENRLRAADGSVRWVAWTVAPDPGGKTMHAVGRDITEQKANAEALAKTEEQLRQAQKMETVGQLTGGVAHDFNNLLQIVSGNLETILRNADDSAPRLRRAAENAMTGARRAATLTQRLLAFSRRQPLAPKPIDVNKLVVAMSELIHRTLGETIEIETVLSSGLWRVEADPNQLETAILNLALNGRDAMPDGGKLTIETANTHLDRSYVQQNTEVVSGQYVVICVSDTGTGMDEETKRRAFEPFYTTKEVGKGTGLGLSMVYGFVKQSGGHVKVYSEYGTGTTVKIYLPRLLGIAADEEAPKAEIVPDGTREETILVCEDDDDVRAYSVEMLRELGYRVLEAHDGSSALRLLERQETPVHLLFTDVVLPGGMTGAVLAEKARALRPGLKVLFTTGYARNAIVHHGRLDAGVELITKPFSYADLAARVRDILDAAPDTGK